MQNMIHKNTKEQKFTLKDNSQEYVSQGHLPRICYTRILSQQYVSQRYLPRTCYTRTLPNNMLPDDTYLRICYKRIIPNNMLHNDTYLEYVTKGYFLTICYTMILT